ncbi:MAG: PqqD family protein [Anaerolineales bacterium]|nr:PqqD family protein [Anaerolineales bacterium]
MGQVTFYQIRTPSVIGEVVDGEAIIVNLDTGVYYSLREPGATLWQRLERPISLHALTACALALYVGDAEEITAWVRTLVDELVREGLLHAFQVAGPEATNGFSTPGEAKTTFVASALDKYTDMADLLLLDPIHEVGERGWPGPAALSD